MHRVWKQIACRRTPLSEASLRFLELNCLTHWSAEGESAEEFVLRTAKHAAFITSCQPTIALLVEVDGSRTLPRGTRSLAQTLIETGAYQGISAAKNNEHQDETWILFDQKRVELLSTHTLVFSEVDSQFALIAHLRVSAMGEVLVIGQHAKAGRTEKNEDIRIRHTDVLRAFLHRCCSSSSMEGEKNRSEDCDHMRRWGELLRDGLVIWAGDFNAGPHSYGGIYPARWFAESVLGGMAKDFGFTSAYASSTIATVDQPVVTSDVAQHDDGASMANGETPSPQPPRTLTTGVEHHPFTTYKFRDGRLIEQCIDYVFFVPKGLCVTQLLALPEAAAMPEGGLPSAEWPSDHLALVCDFCRCASTPV